MADKTKDKNLCSSHNVHEIVAVTPGATSQKLGTEDDQRGMARMGRKQELRRRFHFFSITGYAVILGCSWEFAMINIVVTLSDAGLAGSVYAVLVAIFGMFFVQLSFAEMASIAPTSGGQYHWCSEFAPQSLQKPLSYFVGIFCMLGWQTSLAAVCYAGRQQIAALTTLGNPDYTATNWQIAFISFGILILVILANTVLFRRLLLIEALIMVLHVLAFIAFIAVLWALAPRTPVKQVFTSFTGASWSNTGVAFLIALTGPAAYLSIADSAVHLAEEVRDSAYIVPRAMIVTAVSNYILAFVVVVTLMFCIGNQTTVEESSLGQPYLAIILNITNSRAATMALAVVMLILVSGCAVNGLTTISRQIWAFSGWLSRVRPGWDIPMNAMSVSIAFAVVLNLIAMGSDIAYDMLLTHNVSELMTSYLICVACEYHCARLGGEPLPASKFRLGQYGNAINILTMMFLVVVWTFQFLPPSPHPSAAEMNWGCAVYGFVLIASALYYYFVARHTYQGPVINVRKEG